MDTDSLIGFKSHSIPTYVDLFKVKHSDNQALILLEDYLCYRALRETLSLRTSRWEYLVQTLYQYCKDIADQDCKRWLCLVNLSMHVREGITRPTQKSYCDVLKCYKVNGKLFGSGEFHKKMLNELILSVACYFLVIEKDKRKVIEMSETHPKVEELVKTFPDFTDEQIEFMQGRNPHFVLVKILDQLRCVVMKMRPPLLTEIFDEYECAAEEQKQQQSKEEVSPESKTNKQASDTAALSAEKSGSSSTKEEASATATKSKAVLPTDTASANKDKPEPNIDVSSPRRSTRGTPSKYRSVSAAAKEMSTPTKPTLLSASVVINKVTGNSKNDSGASDVQDDGDFEVIPKKKSKVLFKISDTEDEEQPSSTIRSSSSPEKHRRRRGLRDLKVIGTVSNKWSSDDDDDDDDDDDLPNIVPVKEVKYRRRESLELPKRIRYRASSGVRHPWTEKEVANLLKGVETFGRGQWAIILKSYSFGPYRDSVSLKDKWRNMLKNREVPEKYL